MLAGLSAMPLTRVLEIIWTFTRCPWLDDRFKRGSLRVSHMNESCHTWMSHALIFEACYMTQILHLRHVTPIFGFVTHSGVTYSFICDMFFHMWHACIEDHCFKSDNSISSSFNIWRFCACVVCVARFVCVSVREEDVCTCVLRVCVCVNG